MHALQKSVDGSSSNNASSRYASTEESSSGGISANRTYQTQLKNPYIRKNNIIDVLPEEAMYTLEKLMLETTDLREAVDFIQRLEKCSRNRGLAVLQSIVNLFQTESKALDITTQRQVRTAMQMHVGSARGRPLLVREPIFQLVPGVSSSSCVGVREAIWRRGYWHVALSKVMHFKYDHPNGIHAAVDETEAS